MYTEIGSFDAKAQLSKLLRDVQQGHCYTITLRGHPIADLVPTEHLTGPDPRTAIQAMRHINKISGVSSESLSHWIDEGRK